MTPVAAYHTWAVAYCTMARARELAEAPPTAPHLLALHMAEKARVQAKAAALRLTSKHACGWTGETTAARKARDAAKSEAYRARKVEQALRSEVLLRGLEDR